MKLAILVLVTVACGKPAGDDCQKIVDKSRTVMNELAKASGKPQVGDADITKLVERCHDALASGHREPAMDCVLAAKDDDAIRACMTAGLDTYRKTSMMTEAKVQLNRIGKRAKLTYGETAAFPIGQVGPTPVTPCCQQGGKCAPAAKDWADPTWQAFEFSIDEPFRYQYSYASDGKTFTATATADLACDGHVTTQRVHGEVENGNVRITDVDDQAVPR